MSKFKAEESERAQLLARAVSKWDAEAEVGEAEIDSSARVLPVSNASPTEALPLTNAEITHLQVRVIAIENLLKVLLADATAEQLKLMRDVAGLITPQPGFTQHPLTIQAAACMINLVDNAAHLRSLGLGLKNSDDLAP